MLAYGPDPLRAGNPPSVARELRVFPNPAATGITVQLDQKSPGEYRLYDPLGRIRRQGFVNAERGSLYLYIADLPSGAYRLVLLSGADVMTASVQVLK